MSTNDRQLRCRISAPAIVRRPAAFSFSANHTGSFFFVSGFGSGQTRRSYRTAPESEFSASAQAPQCGDDVLRMFVTVVVRLCAVASASPAHHDKLALGARIPNDRRGGLRFGKACVISDTQRPFESHYLPVFSLDSGGTAANGGSLFVRRRRSHDQTAGESRQPACDAGGGRKNKSIEFPLRVFRSNTKFSICKTS